MAPVVFTSSTMLLNYEVVTAPANLVVSETGSITVVVSSKNNAQTVYVAGISLSMLQDNTDRKPPYTAAVDLLGAAAPSDACSITASDNSTWTPTAQSNNTFLCEPSTSPAAITTQGLEITLSGLTIGGVVGLGSLTINEWASSNANPPVPPKPHSGSTNCSIAKFSPTFQLAFFTASQTSVQPGGSTYLSWSTTDAIVQISYGSTVLPAPGGAPLPDIGSQEIDSIEQDTTFTLTATDGTGGPFLQAQRTVSVLEPVPSITSFTGAMQPNSNGAMALSLSWVATNAENTGNCMITGDASEYGFNGTVPAPVPYQTNCLYTLTATNPAGSASAPLTSLTITLPPGSIPMGIAVVQSGNNTTLYIADSAHNNVMSVDMTGSHAVATSSIVLSQPFGVAATPGNTCVLYDSGGGYWVFGGVYSYFGEYFGQENGIWPFSAYAIASVPGTSTFLVLGAYNPGSESYNWSIFFLNLNSVTNQEPATQIVASSTSAYCVLTNNSSAGSVGAYLLSSIEAGTLTPTHTIAIPNGDSMASLAISADGSALYIGGASGGLTVVDTSTFNITSGPVATGLKIQDMALLSDGSLLVVLTSSATVVAFDSGTLAQVGNAIAVGKSPAKIAAAPESRQVYVTNSGDGTVSLITFPAPSST